MNWFSSRINLTLSSVKGQLIIVLLVSQSALDESLVPKYLLYEENKVLFYSEIHVLGPTVQRG
jgi:hypothetical protein